MDEGQCHAQAKAKAPYFLVGFRRKVSDPPVRHQYTGFVLRMP